MDAATRRYLRREISRARKARIVLLEREERALASRQQACGQGHPFTADNTLVHNGKRYCRECAKARQVAFVARRKAKVAA